MRWIFPFFLIFAQIVNAQLAERFDDGNFSGGPEWLGTTSKFGVDNTGRLQLTAPQEASEAWLFTKSEVAEEAMWEVDAAMMFDPSSQNYSRIYLMADNSEPASIKNGFFVMLGGTDDDVSLYKISNGQTERLIDGQNGRLTLPTVSLKLKVSYSLTKGWQLTVQIAGADYDEGKSSTSVDHPSAWTGIYCKYSATRSNKFFFDNILVSGIPLQDRTQPKTTGVEVETSNSIKIKFSEAINPASLITTAFDIQPMGWKPQSITLDEKSLEATLHLSQQLPNDFNGSLDVRPLSDVFGNLSNDTSIVLNYSRVRCTSVTPSEESILLTFSKPIAEQSALPAHFVLNPGNISPRQVIKKSSTDIQLIFDAPLKNKETYWVQFSPITDEKGDSCAETGIAFTVFVPERHDIVISEIMIDPEPANLLPQTEYIELFNRTAFEVSLDGFSLLVSGREYEIPKQRIGSNAHVCLVPESGAPLWTAHSGIASLSSFPSLGNTSGQIVLLSPQDKVMDALNYDAGWFKGNFKDDGGWSFEIIDTDNLSGQPSNWTYSMDLSGGTPGSKNSVSAINPDNTDPQINYLEVTGSREITLHFSEGISLNPSEWLETPQQEITIYAVQPDTLLGNLIKIILGTDMITGHIYDIVLPDCIPDFAGNCLSGLAPLTFGLPEPMLAGDVVFNEILFNPGPDGSDFIELINRSSKILSLADVYLAKLADNLPEKLIKASSYKIPMLPNSLWTFTQNPEAIAARCTAPNWLLKCTGLPVMPNTVGDIAITNASGTLIDKLTYSDKWHFSLLQTNQGVSLERINTEGPTQDQNNWHSASSASGYSTPTAPNSQTISNTELAIKRFTVAPELFTPDGDGSDDFLIVDLTNPIPGGVATIKVFDASGNTIKVLANNELLGTTSQFKWDGTNQNSARAVPGIYLIWSRVFFNDGQTIEEKTACVLSVKRR